MAAIFLVTFFILKVFFTPLIDVMEKRAVKLESSRARYQEADVLIEQAREEAARIAAEAAETAERFSEDVRRELVGIGESKHALANAEAEKSLPADGKRWRVSKGTEQARLKEHLLACSKQTLVKMIPTVDEEALRLVVNRVLTARGAAKAATATSSNQAVVADSNLVITALSPGWWSLDLQPHGIGYSLITLHAANGAIVGRRSFRYAASEMGRPGGWFHTYVADGSAAFAVNPDLMFIGDDENQTLRLYWRNQSGAPVASFDFTSFLNLTNELYANGTPKEMDIEGCTRVGNRIFWISSQSNAETGEAHPNRNRLLTTDFLPAGTNSQLTYVGRYEHLKEDILNWDANNLHGKGANYYGLVASARVGLNPKEEDGSGYNIEGLTMAPGSSNVAYLGFRAPLLPVTNRVKTLMVVVTNFAALAASTGPEGSARFGPPIELNLIGRGIRAMEATPNGVLIVAGPPGPPTNIPPRDFRLFTWDGTPEGRPQSEPPISQASFPKVWSSRRRTWRPATAWCN